MNPDSVSAKLLEALPAAVLVLRGGLMVYANPAAHLLLEVEMSGEYPQGLVGQPIVEFIHPLDQSHSVNRIRRSASSKTANVPVEVRLQTRRNRVRVVLVTSVSVDLEGEPGVLVTAMEVRRDSTTGERMRRSEEHFRRLFENMQDVYYRTDALGVVQLVGPGVRRVLGFEPHEIVGRTAEEYYPNHADRDAFKDAIRKFGEVADFPGQMVRKDGRIIDISISSSALFDEDGAFAGVEGIYRDVTERKELERELRRLASIDSLTNILNRRAFIERAREELGTHYEPGIEQTLLLLDIDYFKSINDQYGHATGDQVLTRFARAVGEQIWSTDLFGRLGGEEFAILVKHTNPEQVRDLVDRVLDAVRTIRLEADGRPSRAVTVSIGAARRTSIDHRVEHLLDRADRALYQAKHGGRDRVFWERTA
ncbi:sensor domain-containing diguanylate cyclase [Pararobbsia alpina]|nr:diguanylate cyclase [Pararobbsia alpina]